MASSTRFSKIGNWFGAADRPPDQVLQSDDSTTITSSASHLDFSPPDGVMLGLDGMGRLDGESTDNIASGADGAIEGNAEHPHPPMSPLLALPWTKGPLRSKRAAQTIF